MQYLGGKSKIAKKIAAYLESQRAPDQPYIEPFMGGASVMQYMTGERYGCDIHPHLIKLWQECLDGSFVYPQKVTKDDYNTFKALKNKEEPDAMLAFVGFGMSYGGKWFGGYASNAKNQDYCKGAANSLKKKALNLQGSVIECKSYLELNPIDSLIYLDPPYLGTTKYSFIGSFNHIEFYECVKRWSKCNKVFISEYNIDGFECVQEYKGSLQMHSPNKQRIERLYKAA